MENINCKKLLLGAFLVALGSTQITGQMPTYSQAQNAYVPVSLPSSVTIGGQPIVGSNVPTQSVQTLSGLSGSFDENSAPVLTTLSTSLNQNNGFVGTQVSGSVSGLGYQSSGVQNVVSAPQVFPPNYQLGYQGVPVQPVQQVPVQLIQPVIQSQPIQQNQPVFGSQTVPTQAQQGYQYQGTGIQVTTGYQGSGIVNQGYDGQGTQGSGVQVQYNPFNLRRWLEWFLILLYFFQLFFHFSYISKVI